MTHCGPILLYDKKCRKIKFNDEEKAGKYVSRLLAILREYRPDLASEFIGSLVKLCNMHKLRLLNWVEHRYLLDNFEPLQFVGAGGFGTVYKTRHKIDKKEYAIKKIFSTHCRDALELARSEVFTMSRLNNVNVVRYITSWLDYEWIAIENSHEISNKNIKQLGYSKFDNNDQYIQSNLSNNLNSCNLQVFNRDILNSNKKKRKNLKTKTTQPSLSSSNNNKSELVEYNSKPKPYSRLSIPRPVLCIQLELCHYNLGEWLQHRNSIVCTTDSTNPQYENTDSFDKNLSVFNHTCKTMIQLAPIRWLMDQMASGVAYLHSENVIHRDLKPENVLICGPPLCSISPIPCTTHSPVRLNQLVNEHDCEKLIDANNCSMENSSIVKNCYHNLIVKICDFGLARLLWSNSNSNLPRTNLLLSKDKKNNLIEPSSSNMIQKNSTSQILSPSSSSSSFSSVTTSLDRTSMNSSPSTHNSSLDSPNVIEYSSNQLTINIDSNNPPNSVSKLFDAHSSSNSQNQIIIHSKTNPYLLTANLGSSIYAAPEVQNWNMNSPKNQTFYNNKADIYSLGVIYFEMLHPCFTKSELVDYLRTFASCNKSNLKSNNMNCNKSNFVENLLELFPNSVKITWPYECQIVALMLNPEAQNRPSAAELVGKLSINSEFLNLTKVHIFKSDNDETLPSTLHHRNFSQSDQTSGNNTTDSTVHNHPESSWKSRFASYQLIDYLLWKNLELQHQLDDTQKRLSQVLKSE